MFSTDIYIKRRKDLKLKLGVGIILFVGNQDVGYNYRSNPYKFRQESNFLYFWGLDIQNLVAIVDIDNNEEIIFGDSPNIDDKIWSGIQPSLEELAALSGVSKVMNLSKVSDFIFKAKSLNIPIHFLPAYRGETHIFLAELLQIKATSLNEFASKKLIQSIIDLRSKKDILEVQEIEQMISVAQKMHTRAIHMAQSGIVERNIAAEIEGICLSSAYNVSFPTICTVHGEILHNPYLGNVLHKGKLLLTDAGAESFLHYASDITRTCPVGGKFNSKQNGIYNIVLNANKKVIEIAAPNITYKEVHLAASLEITKGLISMGIMKGDAQEAVNKGAHTLFFPHGIGHMLGLDVHDMEGLGEDFVGYNAEIRRSEEFGLSNLRMARKLETDFVVTNEPGIYFIPILIDQWEKEKKFSEFINYNKLNDYRDFGGIRIEDDLIITEKGCRNLSASIPKEVNEIENTFKNQ